MPANSITIAPNKPLYIALVDPKGRYDFEEEKGYYQTTDGRALELPESAVVALNLIDAQPGEEVQITRHWSGKHREFPTWTVCLSAKSENARAEAGIPDKLTEQLEASLEAIERQKAPVEPPTPIRRPVKSAPVPNEQPKLFDGKGTGTYGPTPEPAAIPIPAVPLPAVASGKRQPPAIIPWNVAFREVSAWVSKELQANNLQWSDEAQQAMVCTCLIAEVKAGRIGTWQRES